MIENGDTLKNSTITDADAEMKIANIGIFDQTPPFTLPLHT